MKRPARPDELRLWALVASTVRPSPGRAPVVVPLEPAPPTQAAAAAPPFAPAAHKSRPRPKSPGDIEPGRKRRLVRERDPIDLTLDLHGLDQDRAKAALNAFLHRAQDQGVRAVLVITGKGSRGDGVLRRMAPEWLAEPGLRGVVAGTSEAHRRHGGEGALYVALKRRV